MHPDPNRKQDHVSLAEHTISFAALKSLDHKPRVLLVVPPYTRRVKFLDIVEKNLRKAGNEYLDDDLRLIQQLKEKGIASLEESKRAGQPIGLMQIAAQLKERGYEVKILDAPYQGWENEQYLFTAEEGSDVYRYGLSNEEIAQQIKDFAPDLVGISCIYTNQSANAFGLARLVKEVDPQIVVAAGGGVPTALPESFLRESPTNIVIRGQGDYTLYELVKGLEQGDLTKVSGIAYLKDNEVIYTSGRRKLRASEIKIDYGFIDLETYSGPYHSGGKRVRDNGKLAVVFATRGCDTGCSFCSIPRMQGSFSEVGLARFGETLDELVNSGVTEVIVEDDNLMHDPQQLMGYCNELQKRRLAWFEEGGISAYSLAALLPECTEQELDKNCAGSGERTFGKIIEARAEGLTTEKVIKKMAESGCYHVYLAVESKNENALSRAHKPTINTNEKHIGKVIELFNQYEIDVTVGLMLGFVSANGSYHTESREQIQRTIDYGRKLRQYGKEGKVWINLFIFTPIVSAPHFPELAGVTIDNADLTGSHEWCSINYEKLAKISREKAISCADEMNLLRTKALIECNGIDSYITMRKTGTWPMGGKQNDKL